MSYPQLSAASVGYPHQHLLHPALQQNQPHPQQQHVPQQQQKVAGAGVGSANGGGKWRWMPGFLQRLVGRMRGSRAGGMADLETLAGEVDVNVASGSVGWPWWWWLVVLLVILLIIGLVIWWVVMIVMPKRVKDISVRDVNARDIAACGNMTVAGLAVFAGTTKITNAVTRALSFTPVDVSDLNISLDGTESSIVLTNQSGSIVTVTLPPAADHRGFVLAVFNETTNPVFHVNPFGTDTIEGSNLTAVENSSALFVSMGTTPSGLADWKQIM